MSKIEVLYLILIVSMILAVYIEAFSAKNIEVHNYDEFHVLNNY